MPILPNNPPAGQFDYNPGVTDQSGQILAKGISAAGSSVADTIDTLSQRYKQTKAMRTMAVDGLNMDPDEVDKMDLPTLQGKLQGAALKSANAERQAQIQMLQSHANYFNGMENFRQSEADKNNQADQQARQFAAQLAAGGQPGAAPRPPGGAVPPSVPNAWTNDPNLQAQAVAGTGQPAGMPPGAADLMNGGGGAPAASPLTSGAVLQMMGAGGLNPDQMEKVSRTLGNLGLNGESGTPSFVEDPATGSRYLVKGKDVLPSGVNPARLSNNEVAAVDEQGQPTGDKIIYDAKGRPTVIRKAAASPRLDEQTLQGYHSQLFGSGNQPGLLQQINQANEQNAKAKAGVKNAAGLPTPAFPNDQLQMMQDAAARIQGRLKQNDGATAPAAPGAPAGAAAPKTRADYDKLPSGAQYVDPGTGKLMRKQ